MATTVFGVRIYLRDRNSVISGDSSIGLYNVNSLLTVDGSTTDTTCTVADGTVFSEKTTVTIKSDSGYESITITDITGNVLTFTPALAANYTVANNSVINANSEFRWIQNTVTGVSNWKNFIVKGGLSSFSKGIDIKRGGNVANQARGGVSVTNSTQLSQTLLNNSIYFLGSLVEIVEFSDTTESIRWRGYCNNPTWDAKKYSIAFVSGANNSQSNLSTVMTEENYPNAVGNIAGKNIPISFGSFESLKNDDGEIVYNGFASLKRTANRIAYFKTPVDNLNAFDFGNSITAIYDDVFNEKTFPCVEASSSAPNRVFKIKIATNINWFDSGSPISSGTYVLSYFTGKYMSVVEGAASSFFGRIEYATIDLSSDNTVISLTIQTFLEENLAGNATVTATDQSWINIVDIDSSFAADVWSCKGFVFNNELSSKEIELYYYDNNNTESRFFQLPGYNYKVIVGSINRNTSNIEPQYSSDGSIDKFKTFLVLPITDYESYIASNLDGLITGGSSIPHMTIAPSDMPIYSNASLAFLGETFVYADAANAFDKNYYTTSSDFFESEIGSSQTLGVYDFYIAKRAVLPPINDIFSFDNVYFGIDAQFFISGRTTMGLPSLDNFKTRCYISFSKSLGGKVDIIDETRADALDSAISSYNNIPDNYFDSTTSVFRDSNFRFNQENGALINGYSNFIFPDITSRETYEAIKYVNVLSKHSLEIVGSGRTKIDFRAPINDMCVIFEKNYTLGSSIYTSFKGRTFDPFKLEKITTEAAGSPDKKGIWGDGSYIYLCRSGSGIQAYTFDGVSFSWVSSDYDSVGGGSCKYVYVIGHNGYIFVAAGDGGIKAYTFNGVSFSLKDSDFQSGDYVHIWIQSAVDHLAVGTPLVDFILVSAKSGGILVYEFDETTETLIFRGSYTTGYLDVECIWSASNNLYIANGIYDAFRISFGVVNYPTPGVVWGTPLQFEDVSAGSSIYIYGDNDYLYVNISIGKMYVYSDIGDTIYSITSTVGITNGGVQITTYNGVIYQMEGKALRLFNFDGESLTQIDAIGTSDSPVSDAGYIFRDADYIYTSSRDVGMYAFSFEKTSTWDDRKVRGDLMESPIDIFEHVCRLQNWSEINVMPVGGWGHNYAETPLINTTSGGSETAGSIESLDANLTIVKNYKIANQILSKGNVITDKIKKSLCRNFFLASWVNELGEECIEVIKREETATVDTINLTDIVDKNKIKFIEPNPSNIYPEPFVLYNKNFATGKYEGALRVTNVDAENPSDSEKESYIEGLSGMDARTVWDRANGLWLKTKMINTPPTDLTNLDWANGEDGLQIAKDYLMNWISWMYNPTCTLSVHYNKIKDWDLTHRFKLQLPHQTNNAQVECLVTKVVKAPNPPYECMIEAIVFSESIPEDVNLQDVMFTLTGDYDRQDDMQTYAERSSTGLDDQQDIDNS